MSSTKYRLPLRVTHRSDGLWTVIDAANREIGGVATKHRVEAERTAITLTAWFKQPENPNLDVSPLPRADDK